VIKALSWCKIFEANYRCLAPKIFKTAPTLYSEIRTKKITQVFYSLVRYDEYRDCKLDLPKKNIAGNRCWNTNPYP
jgi:hypothetical protein